MKPSASITLAAIVLVVAPLTACGSGLRTSTVSFPQAQIAARPDDKWWTPKAFTAAPRTHFEVIGTIELRSARPASVAKLMNQLVSAARAMGADAIVPPAAGRREVESERRHTNPFRPYYLIDDGGEQLLEARAIRFPRYVFADGLRRYAVTDAQLSAIADNVKSETGCVPVWIDLPRGPEIVAIRRSENAPLLKLLNSCRGMLYPPPPPLRGKKE